MEELIMKESKIQIPFKKMGWFGRDKVFTFKYKQATLEEIVEFDYYYQSQGQETMEYFYNFLHKLNKKFKIKHFNKIPEEKILDIMIFIRNTYCKDFYGKVEETDTNKTENGQNIPFSATVAFVIKNSNETLESLLKLSWERINFLSDGLAWYINNQTPEGKEENIKNQFKKDKENGKTNSTVEKLKAQRAAINKKMGAK